MGGFAAGLGLAAAAALVHPDPVRPGGARRAARRFARAVRRPCGVGRWPFSASRGFGCAPSPANPRRRRRRRRTTGRARPASPAPLPRNMAACCGDRGVFGLFVLGAHPLRRVLSAALSRTARSRRADRRRRQTIHPSSAANSSRPWTPTEALRVAVRPSTLAEAQEALARREVFAILDIPAGTERDVLAGPPGAPAGLCRFRLFPALQPHAAGHPRGARATVTADLLSRDARPDGSLYRAALAKSSPVEVLNQPLFNPTGGYASYVVPAAFVLILQQTLLHGHRRRWAASPSSRAARRLAAAAAPPPPSSARASPILLLALPGRGAVPGRAAARLRLLRHRRSLAISWPWSFRSSSPSASSASSSARWFQRRETAVLLFIASSLPLFFLVGVAWPVEAIPALLRAASFVFPSTSAIDGLVRINQMGATLSDVFRDWTVLWGLARSMACLPSLAARFFVPRRSIRWTRGARRRSARGVGRRRGGCRRRCRRVPRAATCRCAAACRHGAPDRDPHRPRDLRAPCVALPVRAGQAVRKGELLAVLDNPELAASLGEAKAAAASARAERDRVYSGVRAEEVAILADSVRNGRGQPAAGRAAGCARRRAGGQGLRQPPEARREQRLAGQGAGPTSTSSAPSTPPRAPGRSPRSARWPMPGSRWPRRRSPTCRPSSTRRGWSAPVDGTVGILVAEPGEVVPVGKPVLTLDVGSERWFAFTLREDALGQLTVGSDVTLTTDDGRRIAARVTELRPLGEFATWRAARAVGDHDLNSFRLRLDPGCRDRRAAAGHDRVAAGDDQAI